MWRQRCCHDQPDNGEEVYSLSDFIFCEPSEDEYEALKKKAVSQNLREQMSCYLVDHMMESLLPLATKSRPNPYALLFAKIMVEFPVKVLGGSAPLQDMLLSAAQDVMLVLIQFVQEDIDSDEPLGYTDDMDNEPDPHDMPAADVIQALNQYADMLEEWLVYSQHGTLTAWGMEAMTQHMVDHPEIDYWAPAALA